MAPLSCCVRSATLRGVQAIPVSVEVVVSAGLPSFSIVGMPDAAIQESKERVRAAIKACGFSMPTDKIVVNLAPGSMRKSGTGFDLPIAIGLLVATGQVDPRIVDGSLVVGELSLQGDVSAVRGLLSYQLCAKELGCDVLTGQVVDGIVPVSGTACRVATSLSSLREGGACIAQAPTQHHRLQPASIDFAQVGGQEFAKRALQVAAAGNHGVLMMGPPGSGKTMLAKCLPTILPPLEEAERIEAAVVHSIAGEPTSAILAGTRPFRSPHHSATAAGLVGGGRPVSPGEISLAHHGVLFLDELAEFRPNVLQELRQPLEEGIIRLTRADGTYEFPARFNLLAASNPCPCGHYGDPDHRCTCTEQQVRAYQNRIGGPLLDRIDIRIDVWRTKTGQLMDGKQGLSSAQLREGVMKARAFAAERRRKFKADERDGIDAALAQCHFDTGTKRYFEATVNARRMSARSVLRCLRLARTIADLDASVMVKTAHIAEASMLRFDSELEQAGQLGREVC